ncbi:hypothetical protein AB0J86_17405 [Micromonospora sp. NPDC049559]|uniref:hypothetical protein n=1 Tax=Micromonospora sp. NPDC049559 TaxID=3155923 RepID=UPI00343B58BC
MSAREWLRVPVGRDADRWRTAATRRTVLAVVHTMATAGHVLDAAELVESDTRVQTVFTQAPDLFGGGVAAHLRDLGAVVVPWRQAVQTRFDLVLTGDCAGVHELAGPVAMLAHGIANNKLAPAALGGPASGQVVGLAAPWLTWYGRLVPALVALSHADVLPVLARQCPQAVPVAAVTGDLCLDRLRAARPGREAYRRALGVEPGQTVVAVSSTWGADSLLGSHWRTLFDLLAQLPPDRYAVRLAAHPAVYWGHGPRQVRGWLRREQHPGLRVVHPSSWRGLVAAADVLIGDHGSATTYAAAAGVPVLRAVAPPGATAPGSPTELLARLAPVLTPHRRLSDQLDQARSASLAPDYPAVARAVTSEPGRAARLLRARLYHLMALAEPDGDAPAVPLPAPLLADG